jgi:hypothetical protein
MTQDINITFSQTLLTQVTRDVKRTFPKINVRRDCWTYHYGRGRWEFHGPEQFYWHGRADNGWEARAKGWSAYLQLHGVEGYTLGSQLESEAQAAE